MIKRHGQHFAAHAILHLGRVNFSLRTVIALEKFKPSAESISIKDVDLVLGNSLSNLKRPWSMFMDVE